MFSFHKPRVYRSTEGCCICRAKSSSSRFTDSRKYEYDSIKCFALEKPRIGEICNACVLLVKRYKRLPPGSTRHWGHVVDARAGPGTKSLAKQKQKKMKDDNSENAAENDKISHQNNKSSIPEKFVKIFKKKKKDKNVKIVETMITTAVSDPESLPTTPDSIDSGDNHHINFSLEPKVVPGQIKKVQFKNVEKALKEEKKIIGCKRRKVFKPIKNSRAEDDVQFFDETQWKRRKTCFGEVYESSERPGFFIIEINSYKPCKIHHKSHGITVENIRVEPIVASQLEDVNNVTVVKKIEATQSSQLEEPTDLTKTSNTAASIALNQEAQTMKPAPLTQKNIIATAPEIVHLVPPQKMTAANSSTLNPNTINNTPALKKHHLFFKRQSESFPTVDTNLLNSGVNNNNNSNRTETPIETETATAAYGMNFNINAPLRLIKNITQLAPSSQMSGQANRLNNTCDPNKPSRFSKKLTPEEINGLQRALEKINETPQLNIVTVACGVPSPNSASSSGSTKFSDNSSDSGFDENVQDRKSLSPFLQEEVEKKSLSHSGVHTMFLSNGVQINGEQQNLVLTGNEVTGKMTNDQVKNFQKNLQNHQKLKITWSGGNTNNSTVRAYYNNAGIRHENGITTILPASSFAASTQTAEMNANQPSHILITPAPSPSVTFMGNNNQVTGKNKNVVIVTSSKTNNNNNNNKNNSNNNVASNGILENKKATAPVTTITKIKPNIYAFRDSNGIELTLKKKFTFYPKSLLK